MKKKKKSKVKNPDFIKEWFPNGIKGKTFYDSVITFEEPIKKKYYKFK